MFELISLILKKIIEGLPIWGVSAGLIHLTFLFYVQKKKYLLLTTSVFLVFYIFVIYPLLFVGSGIGSDSILEAKNFDIDEAIFWFSNLLSINWIPSNRHLQLYILALCGYLIFWFIISYLFKKLNKNKSSKYYLEYISIFLIITFPLYTKVSDVIISYSKMSKEYLSFEKNFNHDLSDLKIRKNKNGLNVLLYIGESTSSMHMNIYGYPRNTTPLLKEISYLDENLIIFDNIWSNHTHTSASLLRALSFDYQKEKKVLPLTIIESKRLSITDLLSKINIKTNLYSNQGKSGSWNLASSIIFKNAIKSFSIKNILAGNSSDAQDKPLDHHYFDKIFDEKIKVISKDKVSLDVFHSYAGHGPYRNFIEEKFKKNVDNFYDKFNTVSIFGESKFFLSNQLEQYDSAIKYIDFSISNVIKKIKYLNKPIVLIYFSDHGESPFTARGHDSSRFISEMARIPFLMYFNDKAKNLRPDLFQKYKNISVKKNTGTLEQLPSTILDILTVEIDSPSFFVNKMFSPVGYEAKKKPILIRKIGNNYSYVKINDFDILDENYIDSTDDATKNYVYSKKYESKDLGICYHRSNTIAKLIRGNFNSNCIEVDISVKDNKLFINHPPSKYTNLTINVLEKIVGPTTKLWIDGKNLDEPKNCDLVLDYFNNNHKLSKNTLIEFPSRTKGNQKLYKCISNLKSLGIHISFYVPTKLGNECNLLSSRDKNYLNSKECIKFINVIKNAIDTNYYTDISFDYKIYNLIKVLEYHKWFKLNTWNINHKEIDNIDKDSFRLVMTKNSDPNYR